MKRHFVERVAEMALLLTALLCALPMVPSAEPYFISLFPGIPFGAAAFAMSRLLRWEYRWQYALAETAFYVMFLLVSRSVAERLLGL